MSTVANAWEQAKQDPRFVEAAKEDVTSRVAFALGFMAGMDHVSKMFGVEIPDEKVTPVPAPEMPLFVKGQGEYTTHHMADGTVRKGDNIDLKA